MSFWKPGGIGGRGSGNGNVADSFDRDAEDPSFSSNPHQTASSHSVLQEQRQRLPVYRHKREFLWLLQNRSVIILVGQTGSGKTTQIPQYALEAISGCVDLNGQVASSSSSLSLSGSSPLAIACTQPRRVAASSVATRVAYEMRSDLGSVVGYAVRFDEKVGKDTRIIYMTDGMLFREAMIDPLLSRYAVIMLDEAHERSLHTDLLCGLLKKIRRKRPDLKIIVSSATLDAKLFQNYFASDEEVEGKQDTTTAILSIEGRSHPIQVYYKDDHHDSHHHDGDLAGKDYVAESVETVMKIHHLERSGDILVFLPGREDIEKAIELLQLEDKGYYYLPKHLKRAII